MRSFALSTALALALAGCFTFVGAVAKDVSPDGGETRDGESSDAAGDVRTDVKIDPTHFCASLPSAAFCSEFSQPDLGEWSNKFELNFGTHVVDDGAFLSPSLSFVSGTPSLEAGGAANGYVMRELKGAFAGRSAVELRFSVRFESVAPAGGVTFARLSLGTGSDTYLVFLNRSDTAVWALNAQGNTSPDLGPGTSPPATNTWLDYVVRIERAAAYFVTVTEGTKAIVPRVASSFPVGPGDDIVVDVGMTYVPGPAPAQRVRYDNVAVLVE